MLAFHLLASVLSLNVIESVVTFYFLGKVAQWWLRGLMAAAGNFAAWLDLPPPWPDEVIYHRYPRHHRKFGVYYKARRHDVIMFGICTTLLWMVASCETLFLTPIHPLDFAVDTPGWAPTTPPTGSTSTAFASVSPDFVSAFIDDWDPSSIVHILQFGRVLHTREEYFSHNHSYFTVLETPTCFNTGADCDIITIVDSGASVCVTPHRSDFVTYQSSSMKLKDLSHTNSVDGEGYVQWKLTTESGKIVNVRLPAVHISHAKVRLLSPQVLLTHFKGHLFQTSEDVTITLGDGTIFKAKYCPRSNLPILPSPSHNTYACFWSSAFDYSPVNSTTACTSLLQPDNTNLTAAQKAVLLWHYRLSHAAIRWVQLLMRDRAWLRSADPSYSLHKGPFLPSIERGPSCDITPLKCASCLHAKSHRNSSGVTPTTPFHLGISQDFHDRMSTNKCILKRGHLNPGDCVSADHYLSTYPGRLYTTFGREKQGYTCGTIFVDHASGCVFNYCQYSTDSTATLASKHHLESIALEDNIHIKHYHTDNGTFASDAFKSACALAHQKISFSGVGAHHQNGVAERNIKTIAQWARANLLHASSHWPKHVTIKYWPQAVDYAVWVFNRMPTLESGASPLELWSRMRSTTNELSRAHVFGCPVYVLDPALQDGGSIPKWAPRSRLGMFLGFSPVHSSLVPLVLNIATGRITPQYHVVFDDRFETVPSLPALASENETWKHILKTFERDCFLDVTPDELGVRPRDPLRSDWSQPDHPIDLPPPPSSRIPTTPMVTPTTMPPHLPAVPEGDTSTSEGVAFSEGATASEGAPSSLSSDHAWPAEDSTTTEPTIQPTSDAGSSSSSASSSTDPILLHPSGRPARHVGTYKQGPANIRRYPIDGEHYELTYLLTNSEHQPSPSAANHGFRTPIPQSIPKSQLLDNMFYQNCWDTSNPYTDFASYMVMECTPSSTPLIQEIRDPRILHTHALRNKKKAKEDVLTYNEAMSSTFQEEFYHAMREEIHTLANVFQCWELVPREPGMKVLRSTWNFRVKRFPDGSVKKFKAQFCACGNEQLEGIDYFETWAPVAQWSTIRTVMILALKLGWCSAQCDITAAFIHSTLPSNEVIYVHQPRGFNTNPNHVLRLNKTLYGLCQSPRHFFTYLTERLVKQGLTQSSLDPCLFLAPDLMVIVYVDDLLVYANTNEVIDKFVCNMQTEEVALRREGTAEGYLGVDIRRDNSSVHLTQSGLTKRIITALGLDDKHSTPCATPAEAAPLPKDDGGDPASGMINYASVVGMLLYLCGHSRPDISFAVHQCARYTFAPTRRHEKALVHIGRYLLGTQDKGLILTPSHDLKIDCYPDADFAGLWNHDSPDDPHCVRSRTGYVITLSDCPVLWVSKLQSAIALSTMEAEYIALSQACKDLFPIMDLLSELSDMLTLPADPSPHLHIHIHEDNVGALTLGKLEPRRMTPRSKHYALRYHWFREHIGPRNIELVKIATADQIGDIFTKGLGVVAFQRLRKKLMGW